MTFRDLQETINRLANDPRVHPNTRVELEYEHELSYRLPSGRVDTDTSRDSAPLVCITLNGCVTLSAVRTEPAVAR